jgi:hypothetical protein
MKMKKNLVLSIILVVSLCLSGVIYASTVANENVESKDTTSESVRAENHKKVDERLNTVWQDIKKTHSINEDEYIELDIDKLNQFINGQLEGFTDKELVVEMKKILRNNYFKVPVGSTKPKILLNKNAKEIVLAYKESDGTNTLSSFKKAEKKTIKSDSIKLNAVNSEDTLFESVVEKTEGEPIPKLK